MGWLPRVAEGMSESVRRVLADPLLFAKDPVRGKVVAKKRADAAKKLADVEARWMKMQEEYETALAEV